MGPNENRTCNKNDKTLAGRALQGFWVILSHFEKTAKWPRQESNLDLELRKLLYYPLYYEAFSKGVQYYGIFANSHPPDRCHRSGGWEKIIFGEGNPRQADTV